MRIKISQLAEREFMQPLHISATVVRDTIENNDQVHTIKLEGRELVFFCKKVSLPDREFYTLVSCTKKGETLEVDGAYKIPKEVYEACSNGITPLSLLEALAQRFGIEVRVGNKTGKFILTQQIPGAPNQTPIIEGEVPKDHQMAASIHVRYVRDADPPYWDCALAFAIDRTQYKAALGL